jgi:heat shock protein HtpX
MTDLDHGPISLQTKMAFLLGIYLVGVYLIARVIGSYTGLHEELLFAGFALAFLTLLNLGGPALMEQRMRVRWLEKSEEPRVALLVGRIAEQANLPEPRIGRSSLTGANAFAFGRTKRDGRICFTEELLSMVNDDELGAVIGHEVSHIRNWDGTIMALLSVVPVLSQALLAIPQAIMRDVGWLPARVFFVAIAVLVTPLVWIAWLALIPVNWFATLLMNYGSRVRELSADRDAVDLGIKPHHLASALYKLSKSEPDLMERQLVPAKPLLLGAYARSAEDRIFLSYLDADASGDISYDELANLRGRKSRATLLQRAGELFSPHPLIEKRFHRLADMM